MLNVGAMVGSYEIVAPLGAGGMGEVYRARDTKLGREVALKVLPEALANDRDRMARFRREAQVLASLNHPNIAAIYGLEDSGSVQALVMELVEGPTLAERIATRAGQDPVGAGLALPARVQHAAPLPLDEALQISKQICEALEAAHEKGIIHRDLKPANIKVTAEGTVKVLDFGLAKGLEGEGAQEDPSNSPTLSGLATQAGMILGTAAYMSPEQAKGKLVDRRTDIWAFGCVLYEMLAGRKAFEGETLSDVLAAVIRAEPDWDVLPATTPAAIQKLVRRCLTKDPKQRLRDIGEARIAIEETLAGATGVPPVAVHGQDAHATWRRALPWGIATTFALAAVFAALAYIRVSSVQAHTVRSFVLPPEGASYAFDANVGTAVLSPDGTRLVFAAKDSSGKTMLWVRPLDSLTAQPLEGTEGASYPFWSPDSRTIAFFVPGKLEKIDLAGGGPQVICDAPTGRGGTWNRQGLIVFAPNQFSGLEKVPAGGGAPTPITSAEPSHGRNSQRWPVFLPDGHHFLFWSGNPLVSGRAPATGGVFVGSLDGNTPKIMIPSESDALYAPPGYLLFLRNGNLIAAPFDAKRLKLTGDAFPVAGQVANPRQFHLGHFSISQTGVLAYEGGGSELRQIVWTDKNGKSTGTVGDPGEIQNIQLSPDGKTLAESAQSGETGNVDIWLVDLARGVPTRLTFNPAADWGAIWSPDGGQIVYDSSRTGRGDLYIKSSNGGENAKLLLASSAQMFPTDWSRDGRFIAIQQRDPKETTGWDIWILPLTGARKPYPFLQTQFNEGDAHFSPNGRWLAYRSDESGMFEVYITSFPGPGGKWQVSSGGAFGVRWRSDGKGLYYRGPEGKLMEVGVMEKGSAMEVGKPQVLFQLPAMGDYDVTPDGKRFLVLVSQQSAPVPVTLVTHWTASLKK